MAMRSVACESARITRGGYEFALSWDPGREASRIYFTEMFFHFEARLFRSGPGRYRFTDLPSFLQELKFYNLWEKTLGCKIVVGANPKTRTDLDVELKTPVAPYQGGIGPENAAVLGDSAPLRYVGTGKAPYIGRMLHPPIAGMRFFKYGGHLTADVTERGFDCITYVGSLFGAQSHMEKTGKELAEHLAAKPVPGIPDSAEAKVVEKYFDNAGSGRTYLLWSGGHVVTVIDRTVHEFTPTATGGYRATPVVAWLREGTHANLHFTLRTDPQVQK
jgi:hypothetical protein